MPSNADIQVLESALHGFTDHKATDKETVEETQSEPQQSLDDLEFKKAFSKSRAEGLKTFEWHGKLFTTRLK